jgi:NAD(P)H-dependent flavin oxidoreductase YrpB (nitropropane dioxygenase family)
VSIISSFCFLYPVDWFHSSHPGVGTRFVAAVEAAAPKMHKDLVLSAGFEDAITTLIFTGRPLRVRRTPYVEDW